MLDVLGLLVEAAAPCWGLDISRRTGRPTGTVYPLLERLETERFLASRWDSDDARTGPRRRVYELTGEGRDWAVAQLRVGRTDDERNAG
jgi:DNA-binding PadR family transcriptional regulator